MKLPDAVIYVAETSCCGLIIHDPRESGAPAHWGKGQSGSGHGYEACHVIGYFEFRPKRRIMKREVMRMRRSAR